jgi:hypothetical protein
VSLFGTQSNARIAEGYRSFSAFDSPMEVKAQRATGPPCSLPVIQKFDVSYIGGKTEAA